MEAKIDSLTDALAAVQNLIVNKGDTTTSGKASFVKQISKKGKSVTGNSNSETTVYENVVIRADNKSCTEEIIDDEISFNVRKTNLSSDEQDGDTSEEMINVTDQFIADCAADVERRRSRESNGLIQNTPKRGEQMVKDAEAAKMRMIAMPGNCDNIDNFLTRHRANVTNAQSIDDNYMSIGGHVDSALAQKIVSHQYIDFGRLLPQDRVTCEEDQCMELINRGGSTFFIPASDKDSSGVINSFFKWEQSFRVFSNVYTRAYPDRASELIQYNHIIFTASQTFTWENVYLYDREFHIHLSNYPERSWSVILQQAWSMCLKDKVRSQEDYRHQGKVGTSNKKENCRRFNKGKCTAGSSCKYDHQCDICGKWGHGAHICRRRSQNSVPGSNAAPATQSVSSTQNHGK